MEVYTWARPCRQFINYITQVAHLLNLTEEGIRHVIRFPNVITALAIEDIPGIQEGKKKLDDAKELAELAKSEVENDFPLLRSHALVGIWGALEAMVEDLAAAWIYDNPSILDQPKFTKIKVPLIEYSKMDRQGQLSFLVSELQRDLGSELKGGINKFESLLSAIGLGGAVDKGVRDVIFEAQNLRNVLAHRGGIADRKFVANCPQLGYCLGDKVKIDRVYLDRALGGFLTYSFIVFNRCAKINGIEGFTTAPSDFEGALVNSNSEGN